MNSSFSPITGRRRPLESSDGAKSARIDTRRTFIEWSNRGNQRFYANLSRSHQFNGFRIFARRRSASLQADLPGHHFLKWKRDLRRDVADQRNRAAFAYAVDCGRHGFGAANRLQHEIDAGHFEIETDLINFTYSKYLGVTTRNYQALDPTFKLGVTNWMDVEVQFNGLQYTQMFDGGSVPNFQNSTGFGDVFLRTKINLFGNDSGPVGLALIPYVQLPSSAPLPCSPRRTSRSPTRASSRERCRRSQGRCLQKPAAI